jgi:hypothetical protein
MRRIFSLATCVSSCMSLFLSTVASRLALGETAVAFDVSPRVQMVQYSQPSEPRFLVEGTKRFPGSYYIDRGQYFHRPASSEQNWGPTVVERGECSHARDLAKRLEYEARTMCHDMADNYRDNPNYSPMYREAYRIWELAKQIKTSPRDTDPVTLGTLVRDLDSRFQPLRREVSTWSSSHESQRGQGTLQAKVDRAEAVIHHLWNDVGPSQNTWVARKDGGAPLLQAPENGEGTVWR